MQGAEVRDAVEGEQHGLAVDDELLMPVLARDLDDPRIAVAPVGAAARDQADAIPLALEAKTIAVVLHFVQPDQAIGDGGRSGR